MLNPEQQSVIKLIEEGKNIFVTGPAGTGKSFLLSVCIEKFRALNKVAVVAPTGTAAIKVGGQTIHSFLKWKPGTNIKSLAEELGERTIRLDILFIDEASMIRADHFDMMNESLKILCDNEAPFGGVQLVIFGDLYQLPPVVQAGADSEFIEHNYESPFFFSSSAYSEANISVVELEEIYRQSDPVFIDILNAVRTGDNIPEALAALNQHVGKAIKLPVYLCTTNATAEYINREAIKRIPGQLHKFSANVSGKVPQAPAPEMLSLKVGSNVMFCRNDQERRWVNGTTGVVTHLDGHIKIKTASGEFVPERISWDAVEQVYNSGTREIEKRIVGCFEQYPLIPADAITIHKSQGATIEKAVIDLGRGIFAHGQLYTALSRCRSLENLSLSRALVAKDVLVSQQVREFFGI